VSRSRPIRTATVTATVTAVLTVVGALAGCGSSAGAAAGPATGRRPPASVSLATAVAGPGSTWSIVQMAGGGDKQDNFWQLLVRSAANGHWQLATPPGVADNGGLVVAGAGNGVLTAGFVPNALLTFTPLAMTADDGARWSQGLLAGHLAAEPGALTTLPGGWLLAVTARDAEVSGPGGGPWTSLVSLRALAATTAGRACGLTALTSAAASATDTELAGAAAGPIGTAMLVGDCGRPGVAGIFARVGAGWRLVGPAAPVAPAGQRITVLRLASTSAGVAALLAAGTGRDEVLIPAWATGPEATWTLGRPFHLDGSQVESVSLGAGNQWGLVLSGRRGEILGQPAGSGRSRPALTWPTPISLPAATTILLPGPRQLTALAPSDSAVTIWQLATVGTWSRLQVIGVPVSPGASG
jgi:hypothetical protein